MTSLFFLINLFLIVRNVIYKNKVEEEKGIIIIKKNLQVSLTSLSMQVLGKQCPQPSDY